MLTRTQQILSGLLVIQLVLAAVLLWPRGAETAESEPIFPELAAEDVETLAIRDNEGNQVELTRQDDGWALASGGDYPANGEAIEPVLEELTGLQTGRLVAQTEASQSQLQVAPDDFRREVVMTSGDGEEHILYLGNSPNAQSTHVRRAGDTAVYLAFDLNVFEVSATAGSWIDTAYVNVDAAAVQEATLENENGALTFVRGEDGAWTLADLAEDETFNQAAFSGLLNQITGLRLQRPLSTSPSPDYGLENPSATLTLAINEENSSRTETLRVGAAREDGSYVVKWSGADYFVTVNAFSVEGLVNNGRDAFLQIPPTPTPEG